MSVETATPKDYTGYSFWLETADDDLTPRPALDGSIDVDVAILGAGFSGLWTAYYLLRQEPSLRVALVEREIAGFGASGRNGGWCSAGFPVSAALLEQRFGREAARDLQRAMYDTVEEVGRVAAQEGIDAQYRKGGELLVARGRHHLAALEHEYATMERQGLSAHYQLLDAARTAARIRVSGAVASLFNPDCAVIHPGRLVRGLAQAVERRGGMIYEGTAVTNVVEGAKPALRTPRGDVRARTVVLAGEAYLARLPALRRQLLPVYSLIVLTEPLSAEQWACIGWDGHECVASPRYTVDYLSRTADGRLLFGGRGAPYHFGSRIVDAYDRHDRTHAILRAALVQWFPLLKGVRVTHAWGGALGMPRDWMPTMSYDPRRGVATARGYTGQGVATTNLSGRVLAQLITRGASPLLELPTVNHRSPHWEPEPLRWLGVRYVQRGLMRADAAAERSGRPPTGRTLPERLGRH